MGIAKLEMKTAYVNGEWVAEADAKISVFDRGFLFADAIYEVTAVADGKLIDFDRHIKRLRGSLELLGINLPITDDELLAAHKEIAGINGITNGLVYLQVSRGAEHRSFVYSSDLAPTVVMFTQERNMLANPGWKVGIHMKSVPDSRWANRHIKTVQLLYSSLSKVEAGREGFDDALFVENGFVTESASANFHIISKEGVLITRELSNALLHGITRGSIVDLGRKAGLRVEQRQFTLREALDASEAFITDSISLVMPVVSIDRHPIGDGQPGPVTQQLRELYLHEKLENGIDINW